MPKKEDVRKIKKYIDEILNTKSSFTAKRPTKKDRIRLVNDLYDDGHTIFLYTARGSVSGKDWSELTKNQIDSWGYLHRAPAHRHLEYQPDPVLP